MDKQLTFSTIEIVDYEDKITNLLLDIIEEEELPENSLYLYSNTSKKGANLGKEISKSICIYEPEYPPDRTIQERIGKNFVIMNIQQVKTGVELLIRNVQFEEIPTPLAAILKELKSDTSFKHVIFKSVSAEMLNYIRENVYYCLKHYVSSSNFGCCSEFLRCSDNKKCVHENKLYAKGCKYNRHLTAGHIFYGKNKNVDLKSLQNKCD